VSSIMLGPLNRLATARFCTQQGAKEGGAKRGNEEGEG